MTGRSAVALRSGLTRRRLGVAVAHDQAVWAVATLAAWAHTIDEVRIGELLAVPFGVANVALVWTWPRMPARRRAVVAVVFGLFWGLAAVPYHLAPLVGGQVTWQNVSGLSRVVAGIAMVGLGVSVMLRSRGDGQARCPGPPR